MHLPTTSPILPKMCQCWAKTKDRPSRLSPEILNLQSHLCFPAFLTGKRATPYSSGKIFCCCCCLRLVSLAGDQNNSNASTKWKSKEIATPGLLGVFSMILQRCKPDQLRQQRTKKQASVQCPATKLNVSVDSLPNGLQWKPSWALFSNYLKIVRGPKLTTQMQNKYINTQSTSN